MLRFSLQQFHCIDQGWRGGRTGGCTIPQQQQQRLVMTIDTLRRRQSEKNPKKTSIKWSQSQSLRLPQHNNVGTNQRTSVSYKLLLADHMNKTRRGGGGGGGRTESLERGFQFHRHFVFNKLLLYSECTLVIRPLCLLVLTRLFHVTWRGVERSGVVWLK